jgi:hypothetical protein
MRRRGRGGRGGRTHAAVLYRSFTRQNPFLHYLSEARSSDLGQELSRDEHA